MIVSKYPIFGLLGVFIMVRYKEGLNRRQQLMFPPTLDEYVDEDNIVRVIDEYVEILNISKLGLDKKYKNSLDGQKAYNPKLFLKIYIYGYLNKNPTPKGQVLVTP